MLWSNSGKRDERPQRSAGSHVAAARGCIDNVIEYRATPPELIGVLGILGASKDSTLPLKKLGITSL